MESAKVLASVALGASDNANTANGPTLVPGPIAEAEPVKEQESTTMSLTSIIELITISEARVTAQRITRLAWLEHCQFALNCSKGT